MDISNLERAAFVAIAQATATRLDRERAEAVLNALRKKEATWMREAQKAQAVLDHMRSMNS